jgi:TonB family protein
MLGAILLSVVAAHAALTAPNTVPASGSRQGSVAQEQTTPEKAWPPAGVTRVTEGITAPRLMRETKPRYTPDAMRQKIEGLVRMEVVVSRTGRVSDVRVIRSLDREFGLDDQAVRAVRQWQFAPASKDGVAVPVLVEIDMTFTLRE